MASDMRAELFPDNALVYGLELTALVPTVADPEIPLENSCIAFYVDINSMGASVKADSFRTVISASTRIFRAICAVRCITPRLEMLGSGVNIADNHARWRYLPRQNDLVSGSLPNSIC